MYFPIVPLARALEARGHEVVMSATPSGEAIFRELGFDFRANPSVQPFTFEPNAYQAYTEQRAADIGEILASEHFDVVVADCLAHGAGLAAERANVPWASFVHYAIDETRATVDHRLFYTWKGSDRSEQDYRQWWESVRRSLGLAADPRPAAESRWCTFSRELTLVTGLPELDHRRGETPAYVHRIGPLSWDPPLRDVPEWLADLGHKRPAVLAAPSTSSQDDLETILRLAEGLADQDVDLVITTTEPLPLLHTNAIVAPFVPHSLLLDKVTAAVCTAGYGLTTRAACAGVPLVLVPRGRDQFVVAAQAKQAGVAIVLAAEECTPERLSQAVLTVLREPRFAQQAASLKHAAQRYNAATDAADLIEQLGR